MRWETKGGVGGKDRVIGASGDRNPGAELEDGTEGLLRRVQ
jgi:hypothetical protein